MTFEFDGEKYRKASSHQKEWGAKLASELELRGSERILDLGCGDGAITAQLADRVPEGFVLGIDASRNMIVTAQGAHERENLEFRLMDINSIDFDNEFDAVVSNAALHWVKDHKKLQLNVQKSLRENGVVRLNFAADGNCSFFFKVARETMRLEQYSDYFKEFEWPWYMPTIPEYTALIAEVPYSEKRVWDENADRYFPTVDAMIQWVDQPSLVPLLKCVTTEDKSPFREYVVRRMIEETKQEDGTCFETFRRMNLFARK